MNESSQQAGGDAYRVEPSRLSGRVRVSGAKNSALRLLAASVLTPEPVQLSNYPDTLLDAQVQVEMLEALGKRCETGSGRIVIAEDRCPPSRLDYAGRSIRNTLLLLGGADGPDRGRIGAPARGCRLGERKHDLHVLVLESLGARVWEEDEAVVRRSAGRAARRRDPPAVPVHRGHRKCILAATLAAGTPGSGIPTSGRRSWI